MLNVTHPPFEIRPVTSEVTAAQQRARRVQTRCGADIKPVAVAWLWAEWLPVGKLTILAGAAGSGKTTLCLGLAAALTSGGKWPDGTSCTKMGNVLIWSGEDFADDTLVPRLIAAGADLNRCHFICDIKEDGECTPFDPGRDIPELNRTVEEIDGVSLLIIDPIIAAVAGDMHRANDVRRSLQAIVDFAAAHDCAVIGVTHFAKGGAGKNPQDRVIGSQAFGALARMVLVTAKEEDGGRRVLARAKSNIAPDDGGVAYSLELTTLEDGIEATRAVWGGIVEGSARDILGEVEHEEGAGHYVKAEAEQFLLNLLASGPIATNQIFADAEAAGYSIATIRRAHKSLGIIARKSAMQGGWTWTIPAHEIRRCSPIAEGAHANFVSAFGKGERLRADVDTDTAVAAGELYL